MCMSLHAEINIAHPDFVDLLVVLVAVVWHHL